MSLKDKLKLGATGQYPRGKLKESDEGELALMVARREDGTVIIDFGKPVAWLGMTPEDARGFALIILKYAEGEKGKQ